jgi:hypothetical protein
MGGERWGEWRGEMREARMGGVTEFRGGREARYDGGGRKEVKSEL